MLHQESKITWDFLPVFWRGLASRAYLQAEKFGAHSLSLRPDNSSAISNHTYRAENGTRISLFSLDRHWCSISKVTVGKPVRFEGAGIYYGATSVEAQLCGGEEVIVVGGGNSAGQAAVFLAQTAKRVYMLVRSNSLSASMSRYLIRRIENRPTIVLRLQTEIVAVKGKDRLESVYWRNSQTGQTEKHEIGHLFIMTGADPNTRWLNGCIALDDKGFMKTGPDLSPDNFNAAGWPLTRQPYLFETSLPDVFAVGDVRGAVSNVLHRQGAKDQLDFVC